MRMCLAVTSGLQLFHKIPNVFLNHILYATHKNSGRDSGCSSNPRWEFELRSLQVSKLRDGAFDLQFSGYVRVLELYFLPLKHTRITRSVNSIN